MALHPGSPPAAGLPPPVALVRVCPAAVEYALDLVVIAKSHRGGPDHLPASTVTAAEPRGHGGLSLWVASPRSGTVYTRLLKRGITWGWLDDACILPLPAAAAAACRRLLLLKCTATRTGRFTAFCLGALRSGSRGYLRTPKSIDTSCFERRGTIMPERRAPSTSCPGGGRLATKT
jgi:hypothetical protein